MWTHILCSLPTTRPRQKFHPFNHLCVHPLISRPPIGGGNQPWPAIGWRGFLHDHLVIVATFPHPVDKWTDETVDWCLPPGYSKMWPPLLYTLYPPSTLHTNCTHLDIKVISRRRKTLAIQELNCHFEMSRKMHDIAMHVCLSDETIVEEVRTKLYYNQNDV